MRGNHLEAYQLNPMMYTESYSWNRMYRLALSDSNSADLDRSRFGLQPILALFHKDLRLRFCFDLIFFSDADITKFGC